MPRQIGRRGVDALGDDPARHCGPTLTATRTPANAAGWSKDDVRVEFTCADEQSGVDVCTPPRTVSSEGRGQSVLGAAEDRAGHAVHLTVDAINIDKTPPGVGAGRTQAIARAGTTVTSTSRSRCGDELSRRRVMPGAAATRPRRARSRRRSASPRDRAGNAQAFDYRHINIDKTPPTITAKRAPALDADGKPTGATAAVFTCSDALSGVLSCPDPVVLDDDDPGKSGLRHRDRPGREHGHAGAPARVAQCPAGRRGARVLDGLLRLSPSLRPSSEQQTFKSTERTCASGPGATKPSESALALCATTGGDVLASSRACNSANRREPRQARRGHQAVDS